VQRSSSGTTRRGSARRPSRVCTGQDHHDPIVVVLSDGQKVTFAVTSIEEVKKSEFPTGRVYDPTVDAQLRLVTCIGPYNSEGHALDSLIVYAVKV
jgi:hypothetical protein